MTVIVGDSRANPLSGIPLTSRADVQRAVRDLYAPLLPYVSPAGARVRLGSFGAAFPQRVAELEGFARPLYGIVPLTVGGGEFAHWDRFAAGLDAGTNPDHDEYWGPVPSATDQRMVEQAAIGLALAFCPEQIWEPLDQRAKARVATWLHGIFEHDPAPNNWQFFRVLVALGLERVGVGFDRGKLDESLALIESYRLGEHWYVDGGIGNVDYYVPFAFHTYGLMYSAANDLGLGDDAIAAQFRERASAFAADFRHWFAPDGGAIPFGRSLTYRFAMSSFWGALAWADVPSIPWGEVKGLALRNLRWWSQWPISDRDGVLSVGYGYDNRRLAEGYNSAGSPYWCMKAFGGLAAPADHPFWAAVEEPLNPLPVPLAQPEPGWIIDRDSAHAIALVAKTSPPFRFMEQVDAKYRKFAYSSAFGFSGDVEPLFGGVCTDSMLALTDDDGTRRVRSNVEAAGLTDGMAWSTWHPWPDVRVDTVLWGGLPWHGRLHRVRSARPLTTEETSFAVGYQPEDTVAAARTAADSSSMAVVVGAGASAIIDRPVGADVSGAAVIRQATVSAPAVNANLMRPHTRVGALRGSLAAGDHHLSCVVFADPVAAAPPEQAPGVPAAALALLATISAAAVDAPLPPGDLRRLLIASRPATTDAAEPS